ncbi:MAG: hypothetical protein ABSF84_11125 [Acidimicrobiales bacterium]|jgi:hypothetical protein
MNRPDTPTPDAPTDQTPTDDTPTVRGGADALAVHAPAAAAALAGVEGALWGEARRIGAVAPVARAARACSSPFGLRPLRPDGSTGPDRVDDAPQDDGEALDGLAPPDRALHLFARQFALDVSAVTGSERASLADHWGRETGVLAACVFVVDFLPRTRAALDALFGSVPWQGPPADPSPPDLWDALDGLVRVVPSLDALDPVTSELVRLRGARQHHCRLCSSLRSRPALRAGADDAVFAAVDGYRDSALSPLQRAALAVTDGMIWTPGRLDPVDLAALGAVATPAQQVELVLDVTRNALNKVAVALGADAAHVEDGIEIYDVGPDGTLVYGLSPD